MRTTPSERLVVTKYYSHYDAMRAKSHALYRYAVYGCTERSFFDEIVKNYCLVPNLAKWVITDSFAIRHRHSRLFLIIYRGWA